MPEQGCRLSTRTHTCSPSRARWRQQPTKPGAVNQRRHQKSSSILDLKTMQKPRKSEKHHNFFRTLQTLVLATRPAASNRNPLLFTQEERRKTTRAKKEVNSIEKKVFFHMTMERHGAAPTQELGKNLHQKSSSQYI